MRDYYLANSEPEHPDTLKAIQRLASSYDSLDRRGDALKMLEDVVRLSRKVNGPEHPDTLAAMHRLAGTYTFTSREAEGLKLREQVLVLRRKVLGPEHPATLSAMHNLAISFAGVGRWNETLKLQEETLGLCRKIYGLEHPDTLSAMHNLAHTLEGAGFPDAARKTARRGTIFVSQCVRPGAPRHARSHENVEASYQDAGRFGEALKLAEGSWHYAARSLARSTAARSGRRTT